MFDGWVGLIVVWCLLFVCFDLFVMLLFWLCFALRFCLLRCALVIC